MAVRSGFFNGVNGDRRYDAKRFAEYFAAFIGNGIFPNPSTNLQVMSNNDMTVIVKAGKAWIDGYILINDDDYILQIDPADGVLNRIDRIVARYDTVDREIRLEIKKGAFASNPVVPGLQRDADAYELGLADIRVNKGIISITQASITDLRLNNELCGIVHGTVNQVDVTTLFNQYAAKFEQKEIDFEAEFNAWFDDVKNQLGEDVAGSLFNQINDLAGEGRTNETVKSAHDLAEQAFQSASDGKTVIASSITAKGVPASSQDTFPTLASKINSIVTDPSGNTTAVAGDLLPGKTAYSKGLLITGNLLLSGNAIASQVLSGQTFYGTNPTNKLTGTMANIGAVTNTLTTQGGQYTIPEGYHAGAGKVTASFANLIASNIKDGINIGGVIGDFVGGITTETIIDIPTVSVTNSDKTTVVVVDVPINTKTIYMPNIGMKCQGTTNQAAFMIFGVNGSEPSDYGTQIYSFASSSANYFAYIDNILLTKIDGINRWAIIMVGRNANSGGTQAVYAFVGITTKMEVVNNITLAFNGSPVARITGNTSAYGKVYCYN